MITDVTTNTDQCHTKLVNIKTTYEFHPLNMNQVLYTVTTFP